MRARRSTTLLRGLAALLLLAALAAGCAADTSPQARVDRWLERVCDGNRAEPTFEPGSKNVAKAGGEPQARAACTLDDEESTMIEAYVFERNPGDDLVMVMDVNESGDGTKVTYAVTPLDGGRWGALFSFTEDRHLLDAIEEEPEQDEQWDIVATFQD